jgi:hypothetical protein
MIKHKLFTLSFNLLSIYAHDPLEQSTLNHHFLSGFIEQRIQLIADYEYILKTIIVFLILFLIIYDRILTALAFTYSHLLLFGLFLAFSYPHLLLFGFISCF